MLLGHLKMSEPRLLSSNKNIYLHTLAYEIKLWYLMPLC